MPSEKAKAYKMKYEAMKHQGKKSGKNTLDEVGEAAGKNAKKVQRYIWLSRLSDELLVMVDNKKLGFSQGVDISFLTEEAQQWAQAVMEEKGCNVSMAQSAKIKEYGKTGELTLAMVRLILTEEKPKERKVTLKADKISEYFAEDCSSEEIEGIIIQLLDEWKCRAANYTVWIRIICMDSLMIVTCLSYLKNGTEKSVLFSETRSHRNSIEHGYFIL